jgi:hypothetical protein
MKNKTTVLKPKDETESRERKISSKNHENQVGMKSK